MWVQILLTILRALLPWISGLLAGMSQAKAIAPNAFAAPMGLSAGGLVWASVGFGACWVLTHPQFGVNLIGRINNGLKAWIKSAVTGT